MRRKGFTLIELLVVVAIIGGLIAILVPALGKARQRARSLQCTTNLRSITQTFSVYVQALGGQPKIPARFLLLGVIPDKMLVCPETRVVTYPVGSGSHWGSASTTWARAPVKDYFYGSYATNSFWGRPVNAKKAVYNWIGPINESVIPSFVDAVDDEVAPDESDCIPIDPKYTLAAQLGALAMRRHGATSNVAFADAHIEAVRLENLWTLRWKSNWKRTQPYPIPAGWMGYVPVQQ